MAVLGPNGVGKTTLLKCMTGMLPWESGGSYIDGVPLREMNNGDIWRKIAYVPQSKDSSLSYTALEMTLMGRSARLGLFSQPSDNDITIAQNALDTIGIRDLADKSCSRMSGGEFQLVLIARALCAEPELMILDEPESSLDFKNQLIILDLLKRLSREEGLAVIFNTHYPSNALKTADSALILNRGGVYICGPSGEVINEENMKKAFSVEVGIVDYPFEGEDYKDVIALRTSDDDRG